MQIKKGLGERNELIESTVDTRGYSWFILMAVKRMGCVVTSLDALVHYKIQTVRQKIHLNKEKSVALL